MMQTFTEEQRKALIGRLNQIAENLKWHNAAYAQDVLLAVDAMNATAPQPVKRPATKCIGWVRDAIHEHDAKWIEAIRAAGHQVEE